MNILNEYVKDPELTPVPKKFLNFISSKISKRKDSIFSIKFKDIFEFLDNYDYVYADDFKNNLKGRSLFDGTLYFITLFECDFSLDINKNATYKFLKKNINDNVAMIEIFDQLILNDYLKNAEAFCSIYDASKTECGFFKDNGMIFICRKNIYFCDSLEYELTHFIQKIVGLNKSLSNIVTNKDFSNWQLNNLNASRKLFYYLYKITNDENELNFLGRFFNVKFSSTELYQSIKAVINGFQRIYERNKFKDINELESKNIDRNEWILKCLAIVNKKEFMINYIKPAITNFILSNDKQIFISENRHFFIVLLYLGIKNTFSIDIDKKILDHFKIFKYKDN